MRLYYCWYAHITTFSCLAQHGIIIKLVAYYPCAGYPIYLHCCFANTLINRALTFSIQECEVVEDQLINQVY